MTALETITEADAKLKDYPDDWYWQNRKDTAIQLIDKGHGDAVYQTQYTSGNCSWRLRDGTYHIIETRVRKV